MPVASILLSEKELIETRFRCDSIFALFIKINKIFSEVIVKTNSTFIKKLIKYFQNIHKIVLFLKKDFDLAFQFK